MSNETTDWMRLVIFSTSLRGCYDNWKDSENISEIINMTKNPMCVNLKNTYPDIDDSVIQSIVLGFLFNMSLTISQYNDNDLNDCNLNSHDYFNDILENESVD